MPYPCGARRVRAADAMGRADRETETPMSETTTGQRLLRTGRLVPDGLDEAMVRQVVDVFYDKARRDEVIGPVFNAAIAEDEWPEHLDLIASFWSSMLLGTASYS